MTSRDPIADGNIAYQQMGRFSIGGVKTHVFPIGHMAIVHEGGGRRHLVFTNNFPQKEVAMDRKE